MFRLAYLYTTAFLVIGTEASISKNFYDFLLLKHGRDFANSVARYDFGPLGSFGGGTTHKAGTKTKSELFLKNTIQNT